MSINVPISSLPVAIGLDGSEYVALDQAGTTKRALVSLINSTNPANLPIGGLTGQALVKTGTSNYQTGWATIGGLGTVQEVDTGTGLTGGPITLSGTISLASVANGTVLANVSGGSAAPIPNTPSAVLDVIGSTRGQILYRGASGWAALGAGSAGQILTTAGAGADPAWSAVGSGSVQSVGLALPGIFTVSGSPVTTTGTLTGTLATQAANLVWSGPTTGAASAPTFRSLVGADLPNPAPTTLGGVKSLASVSHQFLTQIGTDGSVSQAQPAFTDISGTLALSQLGTQTANTVLAGATSGGAANPTFRALVGADLPNPSSSTLGGVQSLASVASRWINQISTSGVPSATQPAFTDISGSVTIAQLPAISNNTLLANTAGVSTQPISTSPSVVLDIIGSTQGTILYRGASSWSTLAVGTDGQVLTTHGGAANPTWTTVTGTGTVTSVASGTGLTGGPITTTGTLSLASIANGTVLANTSGISAAPSATTPTSILDVIGSTQGNILYRGGANWSALAPGTSGQYLQTLGAGSTPQWASAPTISGTPTANQVAQWSSASLVQGVNVASLLSAGTGISITGTTTATIAVNHSTLTNSLGSDVAMNNTANYFDGPTVAQGASGTWFASGTVTMVDTSGAAAFIAKLWDGTTVIASARMTSTGANNPASIALSGYISSPAANIRISCRDTASTSGAIVFNSSGNSKDSTISVVRIA